MPKVEVRAAAAEDAMGIATLINKVRSETFDLPAVPNLPAYIARSVGHNGHWHFVAQQDGRFVGYCALHHVPFLLIGSDEGYLSELFIDGDQRGSGIGGVLLDRAVETAKAQGFRRLRLINMRNRDSYKRGFYAKRGWRERPDSADFVLELTNA